MTILDITDAIYSTLKLIDKDIDVRLEPIDNLKVPCFKINVLESKTGTVKGCVTNKYVDIEIVYFAKSNEECLGILDKLNAAFLPHLKVGDRYLRITGDPESKLIVSGDNMVDLHYLFNIKFYDDRFTLKNQKLEIFNPEEGEKAGVLSVKIGD